MLEDIENLARRVSLPVPGLVLPQRQGDWLLLKLKKKKLALDRDVAKCGDLNKTRSSHLEGELQSIAF